MSQAEFPTDAEPSSIVRWLQIIAGTLVLLIVATIAYAALYTFTGIFPALFHVFPFGTGDFFRVMITASAGMWAGAVALKFTFPRVSRGPVFRIMATLMLLAIVGGSLAMIVKGTASGWEGVVSSIVFLVTSSSFVRGNEWEDLPGRKSD